MLLSINKADIEKLLDEVIAELKASPLDLLSIGDKTGESVYLEHARSSYRRTLHDIIPVAEGIASDRQSVRILEIGAFLGVVSCVLARLGFRVTAHDIPEFMENDRLALRYHSDRVTTITSNLRNYAMPANDAAFDIVIMCETLEHLNFNPLPVLAEINRILSTSGYLYLALPNQASLVNRTKLLFGKSIHNPVQDFFEQLDRTTNMIVGIHWREYTGAELEELIVRSGFSIINHQYYTTHCATAPARVAYTLFPKLRSNQTIIARKAQCTAHVYHFSEATR